MSPGHDQFEEFDEYQSGMFDDPGFSESDLQQDLAVWEDTLDGFEEKSTGSSRSAEDEPDPKSSSSTTSTAPSIATNNNSPPIPNTPPPLSQPGRGLQLNPQRQGQQPRVRGWNVGAQQQPPNANLMRANLPLPKRRGGLLNVPNANGPTFNPTRPLSPSPTTSITASSGAMKQPKGKQKQRKPQGIAYPQPKMPRAPQLSTMTDADVVDYNANAGAGQINSVDRVLYNKPINPQSAKSTQGFFKSDEGAAMNGLGEAATAVGIGPGDERPSQRAVASSLTDEMLGLNVTAKTRFAKHSGKAGAVSEGAKGQALKEEFDVAITDQMAINSLSNYSNEDLETAGMYFQGGTYYKKGLGESFVDHDFTRGTTQRGMNDLQWEDALTGQVDRHSGNIFIDPKTGQVTGIDNDAAFGSNTLATDPMAMARNDNDPFSPTGKSHNRGLPQLIDAETAAKFMNLDWGEMSAAYQNAGLSNAEIAAAKARLDAILAHIKLLEGQGNIVGAKGADGKSVGNFNSWGKKTYGAEVMNAQNSYLGSAVAKVEGARNFKGTDGSTVPQQVGKVRKKGFF